MIPISLTIEGLYSYQKRQTIDFTQLTSGGLFGIFGAVGSGKSSILEAITFALYGETERLNSRDERSYNMMNLKSKKSFIEFEFINYENKSFKIQREYKRNSKKFEEITRGNTTFYEQKEGIWIPLHHTNAEKIIGISYQNFKRTIIIPQGKFRDFIELGNKDRTEMMKEIFHLHRFDLQENVKKIHQKTQEEADVLKGRLESYQEVSQEKITHQKDALKNQKEKLNDIQNQYNTLNSIFQKLQLVKADFDVLSAKKEQLKALKTKEENINFRRIQLNQYKKWHNDFKPLLEEEEKLSKSLKDKEENLKNTRKSIKETEKNRDEIHEKFKKIQHSFDLLAEKKEELEDLKRISEIITFQSDIKTLEESLLKGQQYIDQQNELKKTLDEDLLKIEKEIQSLKLQKIDTQTITEVGQWFQSLKNKTQHLKEKQNAIHEKQGEINVIYEKMKFPKSNTEDLEKHFDAQLTGLLQQKKEQEKIKNHLEVQKKLSQYSENLHHGEPCPLCGALEHPSIHTTEDVSSQILEAEKLLENIHEQEIELQKIISQEKTFLSQKNLLSEQVIADKKTLEQIQNEINTLKNNFHWEDFHPENEAAFEQKRNLSIQAEKKIHEKEQLLHTKKSELSKHETLIQKAQKKIETIHTEKINTLAKIQHSQSLIKQLNFYDFKNATTEQIHSQLENQALWIEKIANEHQLLTQKQNEIIPILASEKTTEKHLSEEINHLQLEFNKNQENIHHQLSTHNINTIQEVKEGLALRLNIEKEEQEINDFELQLKTLMNFISELEKKHSDTVFNARDFKQKETEILQLTHDLDLHKTQTTKIETELERLEKNWKTKLELEKKSEKIHRRLENLHTLKGLFKGGAFVEYASFIFLKQLCENANIRFQKMTKNQLAIQFSEKNNFEIIDYLNEGRVRNVKTLSGGQYFQVALCLALALAETVQAHSKTEQNFFFIDEGFGTLDSESVHIVFETLSNLRKENRIVGIISHVNELKEQIPATLQVIKTAEGSIISMDE